jgi:cyclohexadienyl dehydratase
MRVRPGRWFFSTTTVGVLTFAAALCGCSNGQPVDRISSTTQGAVTTAALRICTTGDYEPLTYRDPATGQYAGIDIEMARDLAAYLGRTAVFVATTWGSLMADIVAPGKCDVAVGGISATPAREQLADFTHSYLANGKTPLTTAADAGHFQSIDQINRPGVRVIENAGGTNEQFAKQNFPNAAITIWQNNATVFGQLVAHQADVMVTDEVEAIYQAKQHPELVAVRPDKPFTTTRAAYMLRKGSQLTEQTNTWLAHVLSDGTFRRIYDRWM